MPSDNSDIQNLGLRFKCSLTFFPRVYKHYALKSLVYKYFDPMTAMRTFDIFPVYFDMHI